MPCPWHGWAHLQYVKVYEPWAQRLVKGTHGDFTLAGQRGRCSECRREYAKLKERRDAAKSAGAPAEALAALEAKLDAAGFDWMTYDPRVIKFYFERCPWVALKLPAVVTHKVQRTRPFLTIAALPKYRSLPPS